MSNYVQLDVWFQEDKLSALSSVLVEQGTTVEKRMQGVLLDMYEALVPRETQEAIRTRLDKEEAEARAAEEAARKYTAFCVRENGERSFFQLDRTEDILEIAKFLRQYLREEQGPGIAALQTSAFAGMEPVTAEQYDQLLALRIETPDKITGAFDLDFDKREVSTVDADGWKTWPMQDVSTAVCHAYRKSYLRPEQYMSRFLEKLEGKELTSAGHLSVRDMAGDAAHGHTPDAGKIVLRQHQTQLNGDNTRIRPEHFKGISYLIQHNISWMGFFKCVVVRLEICAAQHRSKRFYFRG